MAIKSKWLYCLFNRVECMALCGCCAWSSICLRCYDPQCDAHSHNCAEDTEEQWHNHIIKTDATKAFDTKFNLNSSTPSWWVSVVDNGRTYFQPDNEMGNCMLAAIQNDDCRLSSFLFFPFSAFVRWCVLILIHRCEVANRVAAHGESCWPWLRCVVTLHTILRHKLLYFCNAKSIFFPTCTDQSRRQNGK